MGKDFGIFALILGIINVLVGLEVAVFISIIKRDYRWWSYSIFNLFNTLCCIIFFLTIIFGRVGIKKGSSKNMVYAGIILGFIGWSILGIPHLEIVFFRN